MKKTLVVFLVLVILAATGLCWAQGNVNVEKDEVFVQETIQAGDPAYGEGLTASFKIEGMDHLLWNVEQKFGTSQNTEAEFSLEPGGIPHERPVAMEAFFVNIPGGGGVYSHDGDLLTDLSGSFLDCYREVFLDVSQRAVTKGSRYSEWVALEDYYDFYPFEFGIYIEDFYLDFDMREAETEPLRQQLQDFFRIPINSEHEIKVAVEKNEAGEVCYIGIDDFYTSGAAPLIDRTYYAFAEDAAYFTFLNRTEDEEYIDTSYIPGGYGIYRLPYDKKDEDTPETVVYGDQLEMVYPLNPSVWMVDIMLSPDESKLLLAAREEGKACLSIIDRETMELIKKIEVLPAGESQDDWFYIYPYEDMMVFFDWGTDTISVVEVSKSGEYELVLQTVVPGILEENGWMADTVDFAWNGEELAAGAVRRDMDYGDICAFSLWILDQSGLVFQGQYDTSLDLNTKKYPNKCTPVPGDPLKLRWEN